MASMARIDLGDGGTILVEADSSVAGPVKAGRITDAVRDLPNDLRSALAPVTHLARTTIAELRQAAPDELEVVFGVDLSTEAGVMITKGSVACHLQITITWNTTNGRPGDT